METKIPEVGVGSPAGMRIFLTKFPELTLTVTAEDFIVGDSGKERKVKPVRIPFTKQVRPRKLRGSGLLERTAMGNDDRSDKNQSVYWGKYTTDKPNELAFLRAHEYYRKTTQDNNLTVSGMADMFLKELDWDPDDLARGDSGLVNRKDTFTKNDDLTTMAPEETTQSTSKVRPGLRKATAIS